jgi:hypothetical protein
MNRASSDTTPSELPADPIGSAGKMSEEDPSASFDWGALVSLLVHPAKVAIIEALRWIGEPLSATELRNLFDDGDYYLSLISYHARTLADVSVIEVKRTRRVRGAEEKYYYFSGSPPA